MAPTLQDSVWLISGCSTGFGREIARVALERGARVAVTARRPESVADLVCAYPERAVKLALDVTDVSSINAAVADTIDTFGRLDVLVNNAGFGYVAAVEEGEDAAVRAMFEANFFGALALTRAVLPHMRERGGGHIINTSSLAGIMANPGTGYYSASKYALEGVMEALAKELAPLGIRVSSVQPGAFRTDWSGRSMQRSEKRLPAYKDHVHSRLDMIAEMDGKQPGDPARAAKIIVDLYAMEAPPAQLLLGAGALAAYRTKLSALQANIASWQELTLAADFPIDNAESERS